ncbi:MAG TPA: hypothetical protein VFZ62_00860 [Candidatus Saccharimonadales bacterium]
MKRLAIITTVFAVFLTVFFPLAQVAKAQETTPMTEAHIERIRANCVEAQSVLRRLHASDALLRVNRGQLYELLSTRLMAPMNGRIAFNKLDSMGLVAITADYERQLDSFRQKYKEYEESMSSILEMDCTNQPVAFYDKVNETREMREKVNQATLVLHQTIADYRVSFDAFAKTLNETGEQSK